MPIKPATQQESETIIFGAGIPDYWSWWVQFERDWEYGSDFQAPDEWMWKVTAENPAEDGQTITKEVRHADIMRAARKILGKGFDANKSLKQDCRHLVFNAEECDIDSVAADAVLQVVMFGEFVYG